MSTSTVEDGRRRHHAILERLRGWIDQNPLRAYRTKHEVTLTEAASLIGVSIGTIQQWEAGTRQPRPEHQKRLSQVIGQDISAAWKRWNSNKPSRAA